jgi:hypothetical protein
MNSLNLLLAFAEIWTGPVVGHDVAVRTTPAEVIVQADAHTVKRPMRAPPFGVAAHAREGAVLVVGADADGPGALWVSARDGASAFVALSDEPVSRPTPLPDGAFAVVLANGSIARVDVDGGEELTRALPAPIAAEEAPRGVLLSTAGAHLFAGDPSGELRRYSLDDLAAAPDVAAVGSAPLAGTVASVDDALWFLTRRGALMVWPPADATPRLVLRTTAGASGGIVAAHDGEILWGDTRGRLHRYDGDEHTQRAVAGEPLSWPLRAARLDDAGALSLVATGDSGVVYTFSLSPDALVRKLSGRRVVGAPTVHLRAGRAGLRLPLPGAKGLSFDAGVFRPPTEDTVTAAEGWADGWVVSDDERIQGGELVRATVAFATPAPAEEEVLVERPRPDPPSELTRAPVSCAAARVGPLAFLFLLGLLYSRRRRT